MVSSATYEQLLYRQKELITSLNASHSYLHQYSTFFLGSRSEVTVHMKMIEANWAEFRENHRSMIALRREENENRDYFTERYYVDTEEKYRSGMVKGLNLLNSDMLLFRQQELIRSLNSTSKWLTDKGEGNLTRGEIIVRMQSIETNWKDFKDNHKELVLLRDASNRWEPYFSLDCYVNQEAKYMKIMSFIVDALDKLPKVSTDEKVSQAKIDLPPRYTGIWSTHSTMLTSRLSK